MQRVDLLDRLAEMAHGDRMREMVALGRRSASDAEARELLEQLERGGFYERWLALQSCHGSRDATRVLRAIDDASRTIQGVAFALVALVCDDEQAAGLLEQLPAKKRLALAQKLLKRRRQASIDRCLTALLERGDRAAVVLLPLGSAAVVTRYHRDVLPQAGQADWHRFARQHPQITLTALLAEAQAAERLDQRLLWAANVALPALADRLPDPTLDLVAALTRHIPLGRLHLQPLALRRPQAIADLLVQSDDKAQVRFDTLAHRLEPTLLRQLIERQLIWPAVRWMTKLSPAQRSAAYRLGKRGWLDREGSIDRALVALLPGNLREEEGRRHLALPALATRPAQRLPYASFLPWEESRALLLPFLHNPDPDLRVVAVAALIETTRYQRRALAELLEIVRARKNEQDPVRLTMLRGLAALPPGRWQAEHLADLGQILRDALNAADLSQQTASSAERLIVQLLPWHPAWSAGWMATLVQERGRISVYGLEELLSDRDVATIAPALLPVLESWETREREHHILAVAQSLGRRLRVFDGLVELVERLLRSTISPWTASQALHLLTKHRRERIPLLIPQLLKEDPSWITQAPVHTYLHLWRQDLLTPYLGQTAFRGRFGTGKTYYVLPLYRGFVRWTEQQQEIFAQTLARVTHDEQRDSPALRNVIHQLAALPAVSIRRLIELADLENPKPAIRDVALRALGRLDAGQGIPVLLEALGDERARIAIAALRKSMLDMPPVKAFALLKQVPLVKVTVAKEVVRLLGELPADLVYPELLALNAQPLHRDVRVALLRAFWDHLEVDPTWPILEAAAQSEDPAIAAGVVRIPAERLTPQAQRRLARLLGLLLAHADPKVRLDTLKRCVDLPLSDEEQVFFAPLLGALSSGFPDECAAGARAIFATYMDRDAVHVGRGIAQIRANRRSLTITTDALLWALRVNRVRLAATAEAVIDALQADPYTARLRVVLAAAALPWRDLTRYLTQLAAEDELNAEVLLAAVQALQGGATRSDASDLGALETAFADHRDERLRRMGLAALTAQAAAPRGWDDARLARLQAYRSDPSVLVAAAAQFTLPPVE